MLCDAPWAYSLGRAAGFRPHVAWSLAAGRQQLATVLLVTILEDGMQRPCEEGQRQPDESRHVPRLPSPVLEKTIFGCAGLGRLGARGMSLAPCRQRQVRNSARSCPLHCVASHLHLDSQSISKQVLILAKRREREKKIFFSRA